jgi:signal transduction histidine kinase
MLSRTELKLLVPSVAISLLIFAVGIAAAWYTHRLQLENSEVLVLNVGSIRAAEELEIRLRQVHTELVQFLLTGEEKYLKAVPGLRSETDKWMQLAEQLATTAPEQRWMSQARGAYDWFYKEIEELSQNSGATNRKERIRELAERTLTLEILPPVREYLDFNEEVMTGTSGKAKQLTDLMVAVFLILGICGAGAGLIIGYNLARAIRKSIGQLSISVQDTAGKLNEVIGPITVSARWDFAQLEATLQQIALRVGTVVDRLQQSQRQVMRADQLAAVGQLAAGMAHEIRNPLSAMKVLVDTAAESGEHACLVGRDVQVLQEEITRVETLTQSFLDFARPPALEKQLVAIQDVISDAITLVRSRADQQGVAIETSFPQYAGVAEADRGQIRQVMINLLLNALDATSSGGTIRVRVTQSAAEPPTLTRDADSERVSADESIVISIADTGCGLPPDLGDKIFEPFVSTKDTGLGLGLSICKRIVEDHGGRVVARNHPGGGAEFVVRLPHAIQNRFPPAWERIVPSLIH